MARLIGAAAIGTVAALGCAFVVYLIGANWLVVPQFPAGDPDPSLLLYLLLQVAVPVSTVVLSLRSAARRWVKPEVGERARFPWSYAKWPIVAGYVITATFGGPAAHNSGGEAFRTNCATPPRCSVRLETYVTLPVLPLVVL